MKNYSSKKAQRGRIAYRMPDRFIYRKYQQVLRCRIKNTAKNKFDSNFGHKIKK